MTTPMVDVDDSPISADPAVSALRPSRPRLGRPVGPAGLVRGVVAQRQSAFARVQWDYRGCPQRKAIGKRILPDMSLAELPVSALRR